MSKLTRRLDRGPLGTGRDRNPDIAPAERFEVDYTPYLDHRRLRSVGSASDHARLVMAYALALTDASNTVRGHHPGFLVFDEPLQQNPDPPHRRMLVELLVELAGTPLPYDVLIFTSLEGHEVANVNVLALEGDHFLKLLQ